MPAKTLSDAAKLAATTSLKGFCLPMIISYLLPVASTIPTAVAQTQPPADPPTSDILDDYVYGFTPVLMKATRDLATAVPDNKSPGKAPINQFAYRNTLETPQDQTIVRPNADTLYTSAWLDLLRQPIVLHVPDTAGRYYLIPMLDAYSNEFASIGSRTTGDGAGNYAIVGPDWKGPVPRNVSGVIRAPTNTVWLLGRTLVRGPTDVQDAAAVAGQFLLIPLSAYAQYLRTGSYTPAQGVPVIPPDSNFASQPLLSSPGFSSPVMFDYLLPYALLNPPPPDQIRTATGLVVDGFIHQGQVTATVAADAAGQFIAAARSMATTENGWSVNFNFGNYGSDYPQRGAAALLGFGANIPEDAVYLSARGDIKGKPLSGTSRYVIHFAPGQTPPERGFWSITAYDQQGFLVANPIARYSIGSETVLATNTDGSIDIFLQAAQPSAELSNWLPVPAGTFNLTLRVYWPDESVLTGAWQPPAVTAASP
jgi:hypothetical protein